MITLHFRLSSLPNMSASEKAQRCKECGYSETRAAVEQIPPPGTFLPLDSPCRRRPETSELPKLFQPLKLRDITFNNRIVVSPMCMYSSHEGAANDFHLACTAHVRLGQYALRGVGLIIMEASSVVPEGRISPQDAGIWKDEHIAPLKRIVDFVHSVGSRIGIQIAHAGRKASVYPPFTQLKKLRALVSTEEGGWPESTVAPSAEAYDAESAHPHELTKEQIRSVVCAFADAAKRADKAGFDVLEVHGAHGYLIHEFLSPMSNLRTDEYGGTLENRLRFLQEVIVAIREVWPSSKPLFLRISATDWVESSSWNVDEAIAAVQLLKSLGIDLVDVSSGGSHPSQKIIVGPHFQVPFASAIRKATGVLTGVVGMITSSKEAENTLQVGDADLVLLGREFLRNPNWPLQAAHELGIEVKWLNQYERGKY